MLRLCLKEWRQLWREQRLAALYFLLLLAAFIALGGTLRSNRQEDLASRRGAVLEYERWLNQGEKYAHAAAHYGLYVFRPVYGLSSLDPGVSSFVGHSVWLEAHVQDGLLYRPIEDGTAVERLGSFSPAFLLLTLLPLFTILLGYGSFAAERERGTLRLALVHATSLARLVASKLLVLFGAAAIPLILVFATAAMFSKHWHMLEPGDAGLRWFGLLGIYLALLLFWILTTISVSALARNSGQALTTLLALWCLLSVVIPRAAADLAAKSHPVPTQQQLAASMAQALGDVEGGDRESVVRKRLLTEYHVDSTELLPFNWEGVLRNEGEEAGNRVFDRFWGLLFSRYREQQSFVARLSLLSPPLATSWLSQRLASTDIQAHVNFIEAAEAHRRFIERTLNNRIREKLVDPTVLRPNSGREIWSRIPPFSFAGASLRHDLFETSHDAGFAIFGLVFATALAAGLLIFVIRQLRSVTL